MSELFGRAGSGSQAQRTLDGQHIEAQIEITPEEGAAGAEKRISLQTDTGARTIDFKVPQGVKDGETIRLKGQGRAGAAGGKAGDLRMTVRLVPSARFTPEGTDLVTTADVYPWDAALGTKHMVDTLDGRIAVNIPAGVQSGSRIRVAGKGYPVRSGKRGDLFIKVRIVNPARLSREQKGLYEKLRDTVK
jgi:curved DNA-binding protein